MPASPPPQCSLNFVPRLERSTHCRACRLQSRTWRSSASRANSSLETKFWHQSDLERKLDDYQRFYNQYQCHTGLGGVTPARRSSAPAPPLVTSIHIDGDRIAMACFRGQLPRECKFATQDHEGDTGKGSITLQSKLTKRKRQAPS